MKNTGGNTHRNVPKPSVWRKWYEKEPTRKESANKTGTALGGNYEKKQNKRKVGSEKHKKDQEGENSSNTQMGVVANTAKEKTASKNWPGVV